MNKQSKQRTIREINTLLDEHKKELAAAAALLKKMYDAINLLKRELDSKPQPVIDLKDLLK